jgi:hypothetical protein
LVQLVPFDYLHCDIDKTAGEGCVVGNNPALRANLSYRDALQAIDATPKDGNPVFLVDLDTSEMTTAHWAVVQRVSPQREGASIATTRWLPPSKTFEGSRRSGRVVARAKLMSEYMLDDASAAYNLRYVILRNVAGADPAGRLGQSTPGATRLIKAALETDFADAPT